MAMSAAVFCTLVLSLLLGTSYATVGDCIVDNIPVQQDFDMTKYMGRWYQHRWVNTVFQPVDKRYKDFYHVYVPTQNETTIYMSGRYPDCFTNDMQLTPTTTAGKYTITGSDGNVQPYWIIETDYTQYAFVYRCFNVSSTGTCDEAHGWVFSRTQELPQTVTDKMTEFQTKSCLPSSAFLETVQEDAPCKMPKLYKINSEQNCRVSDIQVQESFHKQKYSGLWYEIRWMMQDDLPMSEVFKNFQQELILEDDGKITVYARARLTACMYFTGVLTSSQAPEKFRFTSTDAGPDPYQHWLIDTDYDNYALMYGCQKIASNGECENARAAVWSRRPTLHPHYQHKANSVLQRLCVNPATFLWTPQDKACPPKKMDGSCTPNNASDLKQTIYIPFLFSIVTLTRAST